MTAVLAVAACLYGLVIGSFLNVVIHRVPLHQSVVRPPSACPACESRISPVDNIPLVSWIALRGRCRSCGAPISARYPAVEALTALAFVATALRFGWSATLPAEIIFVAGLVALSFIDYDHMLLPKVVVYPLGALVLAGLVAAAAYDGSWHRLEVALACAAVEFALLFALNAASPRSLGFGDVRFGPVIALALGWLGWRYALGAFFAANLLGAGVGIALIALRKANRRTPIPFGVFLSAGAFAVLMLGGAFHYPA